MKNLFYFFAFCFSLNTLFPQTQDNTIRYLLSDNDNTVVSGFGGFSSNLGTARGKAAYYGGGGGAALINYKFFVGGFGLRLSNENTFDEIRLEPNGTLISNLSFSYGLVGLWMGYSFNHQNPIHLAASIKSGIGAITVFPKDFEHVGRNVHEDLIYGILPEIMLEINMLRWWRIQITAGYLSTFGIDNKMFYDVNNVEAKYFKSSDFSTPMIGISMIFGGFGPKTESK